jgi:hypothetical protein
MQFPNIAGALGVYNALTTVALTATTQGPAVDTSALEGNLLAILNSAAASASDTLDVTVEESLDGSTGWAAVPADALFSPTTGAPTTFTQVTQAAASLQQVGIVKERIKRYIRLVFTVAGSGISIPASAVIAGALKYS